MLLTSPTYCMLKRKKSAYNVSHFFPGCDISSRGLILSIVLDLVQCGAVQRFVIHSSLVVLVGRGECGALLVV